MDEIVFRKALESESGQIKDLIHLVDINPSGLDWKRFIVGVNASGEVIACGQIKPHGADAFEMASIAVHPDFRERGHARKIMEMLLEDSPRPMYLMCLSHNGPMYEKFGFHVIDGDDLPKYFRRMKKLFSVADVFMHSEEKLLVMKLE